MSKCNKCKKHGLKFNRKYEPSDLIEGKLNSRIWIVGINPKADPSQIDPREARQLEEYFEDLTDVLPYFRSFDKVSQKLFDLLGKDYGVAHVDIVKCYSRKFPPNGKVKVGAEIVSNCRGYFEEQLRKHSPQMLICNGIYACNVVQESVVPNSSKYTTSYIGEFDGKEIMVVLSGFVGRIDNYARTRLGKEIQEYIKKLKIV